MLEDEKQVMKQAEQRSFDYLSSVGQRNVYPTQAALDGLRGFDEALPEHGCDSSQTLAMLDTLGSPATVVTNGPRYFGFVVGAALPAAAAAERLMLAWDQGAAMAMTSPACASIEEVARRWLLEILDLPSESGIGFGTSATACGLTCLTVARSQLLLRAGWDLHEQGVHGAPLIRVVVSETVHVTILKALRILGFGQQQIIKAPVDQHGRIDPERLPALDAMTILCLQAGEVNTGEFDPFSALIPRARQAGAWVHVDGAFGLWARASALKQAHTAGVEEADSWTVDGHKWLNTPYDCAMSICRDADALAQAMNSDAAYASGSKNAQKNLTLEFSRRARGVPVWAALRSLGKSGVAAMVERHCAMARELATLLKGAGLNVLNRVVLNQVVVQGRTDHETTAIRLAVEKSGEAWFGPTVWKGSAAFRISISSWRTEKADIDRLFLAIVKARDDVQAIKP